MRFMDVGIPIVTNNTEWVPLSAGRPEDAKPKTFAEPICPPQQTPLRQRRHFRYRSEAKLSSNLSRWPHACEKFALMGGPIGGPPIETQEPDRQDDQVHGKQRRWDSPRSKGVVER
jgi:hypothetical protein